jgi:DNA-binding beta-propeller fold protein YncE
MTRARRVFCGPMMLVCIVLVPVAKCAFSRASLAHAQTPGGSVPVFELDPSWPKPLPNDWMLGSVYAVAIDSRDHVWILQSPRGGWPIGNQAGPRIAAAGKKPAPNVIEFDPQGDVVKGWGGPGIGYTWMDVSTAAFPYGSPAEHGMWIDRRDNVWVTGNGHVALKFTPEGKFLLQIGRLWRTNGSNDRKLLGNPTDLTVDSERNEVYIADGYVNHRVIVFDANTGEYKRHWGAYGRKATDDPLTAFDPAGPPPQQFMTVHCVRIAKDGLVYVCDRQRNRLQVFRRDGTFVREAFVAKDTPAGGGVVRVEGRDDGAGKDYGSVGSIAFSADPRQQFLYIGDTTNGKIWILRRNDLEVVGSFGRGGHMIATDSRGNLYANTVKYAFKGFRRES